MFSEQRCIHRHDPEYGHLCTRFAALWGTTKFPGKNPCPLPCSLDASTLPRLQSEKFWVSRKLDGERFQLMLTMGMDGNPISALVDRLMNMWEVEMIAFNDAFVHGSLIDGELMQSEECPIFCAFDAIAIAGKPVRHEQLSSRLQQLNACLRPPSVVCDTDCADEEHRIIMPAPQELHIAVKEMRHLQGLATLRDQEALFPSDGWIFTAENDPVSYGTCKSVLKWKHTHTVDFLLDPPRLWNPRDNTMQKIDIDVKSSRVIDSKAVYECRLLGASSAEVLHARPDKDKPNSIVTFERTLRAVADNITEDQLVAVTTDGAGRAADA
jgi:hypothetical protein